MTLYRLFSYNVEIQYKSYFLSKAMLFTLLTAFLNIVLPFVVAYRSRGFWLKSHSFYEQPTVHLTYDYILIAETEDPGHPIVCSETPVVDASLVLNEESCSQIQIHENDHDGDGKSESMHFKLQLNMPTNKNIMSMTIILGLNYQLRTICPLHMQTLAIIDREFTLPTSSFNFYGDLNFYQAKHLPCARHLIDVRYNNSVLTEKFDDSNDILDNIFLNYFNREVITKITTLYSRLKAGYTGVIDININLRVPEMQILYQPSLLQELKWAWPQYLSLAIIFYWIFSKIKKFVFQNRLLMAWEVVPFKNSLGKNGIAR